MEVKCKDATTSDRQTVLQAQLVETFAVGRTMRSRITAVEDRIKALKTQLTDAQLALEKLVDASPGKEGDHHAKMVAAKMLLDAEKARVKRSDRALATKAQRRQQLFVRRGETSQTLSCLLAELRDSSRYLQLNVANMPAKRNDR